MDIPAFLDTLKTKGITVTLNGGRLRLVPGSRVSRELAENLRMHKSEVLEYLQEEEAQGPVDWSKLSQNADEAHVSSTSHLLQWASELAEQDLLLPETVSFVEAPLRTISTERVSWYAAHYLKTISFAKLYQRTGGWGRFVPVWWKEREQEALGALAALREALERPECSEAEVDD